MARTVIMDHPLIQHKIGIIRKKDTSSKEFREMISEIAMLMCYEATRELPLTDVEIETPICKTTVVQCSRARSDGHPVLRRKHRHPGEPHAFSRFLPEMR